MLAPSEFVYPTGFDKALSLMVAGEGEENGIDSHRVWPTLPFPALTTEQIGKALKGNTLAIAYHYARQYNTDGKVGGYNVRFDPVDLKNAPRRKCRVTVSCFMKACAARRCMSMFPAPGGRKTTSRVSISPGPARLRSQAATACSS